MSSGVHRLARHLRFLERALPRGWRIPVRYYVQRLLAGLEPEMSLLPRLIAEDQVAVDVGANSGTYCIPLSVLCRQVVAFEPLPDCAKTLAVWAKGRNVVVHACGLGEGSGELTLNIPRAAGMLVTTRASFVHIASSTQQLRVPVRTLDEFELQDVGLIKIDVEGFELATLRGAAATIRRCRPNLLIEIDRELLSEQQCQTTVGWLAAMEYHGFYLDNGRLVPLNDIYQVRPDLVNFVFLPNPHLPEAVTTPRPQWRSR
jgi:FkbM family methyltransferase